MLTKQEDIDHIVNVAMQGKPIEPIEVEFVLEDFIEGEKLIIGENLLFEIEKVADGKVLLKPIGLNILAKQRYDLEKNEIIQRYIKNGEIVEIKL